MILNQLGIFGWKEADENLILASLLTGDPLLLIGNHGCAKTHAANKVAQALGRRFLPETERGGCGEVLERTRHGGAVDQRRQERREMDSAFVPRFRRQPGAAAIVCLGIQPGQLPS